MNNLTHVILKYRDDNKVGKIDKKKKIHSIIENNDPLSIEDRVFLYSLIAKKIPKIRGFTDLASQFLSTDLNKSRLNYYFRRNNHLLATDGFRAIKIRLAAQFHGKDCFLTKELLEVNLPNTCYPDLDSVMPPFSGGIPLSELSIIYHYRDDRLQATVTHPSLDPGCCPTLDSKYLEDVFQTGYNFVVSVKGAHEPVVFYTELCTIAVMPIRTSY